MKIRNKTAQRDYEIMDTYEAGIVLTGQEVKAVRTQGMKLEGSYVKFVQDEPHLINTHIPQYTHAPNDKDYDPTRSRKLLLNKKEILTIKTKMDQKGNTTLIPLSVYTKRGLLKAEIAIAKARKSWEKKKVEARKTEKRRIEKEMKEYMKK